MHVFLQKRKRYVNCQLPTPNAQGDRLGKLGSWEFGSCPRSIINGCNIERLDEQAGRCRRSAMACGAWPAGRAATTRSRTHRSIARSHLGCNFFDTAFAYGEGHSERLLGAILKRHPDQRLYVATKIPPKNRKWPAKSSYPLDDVFPADYIREYTETSLKNLGVQTLDLQQFHVWADVWAKDDRWQRVISDLKCRRAGARGRHQRQPLAAGERAAARSAPGSSTRCRSSTTSSIKTRKTNCSRPAPSATSRSSPACRSTKAA